MKKHRFFQITGFIATTLLVLSFITIAYTGFAYFLFQGKYSLGIYITLEVCILTASIALLIVCAVKTTGKCAVCGTKIVSNTELVNTIDHSFTGDADEYIYEKIRT